MLDDVRHVIAQSHTLVETARELCVTARRARLAARAAVARASGVVDRCRATEQSRHRPHDRTAVSIGEEM